MSLREAHDRWAGARMLAHLARLVALARVLQMVVPPFPNPRSFPAGRHIELSAIGVAGARSSAVSAFSCS